ncbi:hypothetical protein [Vulcanisaeta thermophila]|uniref:hypothetical protein n=1 Tax=Vulcanisaeta thermophila TaxID=867917 RepID=UPI00117E0208|nr:hypothetical protein [Vulcanisaeta thermophila]
MTKTNINKGLLIKAAALYMVTILTLITTWIPLVNAIYGWLTGQWTPLVSAGGSFVIGFTLGAAWFAASRGITLLAAMAVGASVLTPYGWLIIGGVFAGL